MDLLKNKFLLLITLPIVFSAVKAQNLNLPLSAANSQLFNKTLFSYGIRQTSKQNTFCIYKIDQALQLKDSLLLDLGKNKGETFLQCSSDTAHNFLNVYVQKKDANQITVLRFNKNFELLYRINDVDIARLNSISSFNNELYHFEKDIYTLKTQKDSSGFQFYLNKHRLKSDSENFDYLLKWQFPFERKNIEWAHTFYADKNIVLLYVNIASGLKSGQWILKIGAESGQLMKGTRLNDKTEENVYTFGNFHYNLSTKTLLLVGQKFPEKQFQSKQNLLSTISASFALTYIMQVDSIGDVVYRQDFKLPILEPKPVAKKTNTNHLLQFVKLKETNPNEYSIEIDLYKTSDRISCYNYCNTITSSIKFIEEKLQLEKKPLSSNTQLENFVISRDKLDRNGKFCIDSLNKLEQVFYKEPAFPVKLGYKPDSLSRPKWLLSKTKLNPASISYQVLQATKSSYELKTLEEISKNQQPSYHALNNSLFILSRQSTETNYLLKLLKW